MNANVLAILIVSIKNVLIMGCWSVIAIHFDKWWIALFAILCFTSLKVKNEEEDNETD